MAYSFINYLSNFEIKVIIDKMRRQTLGVIQGFVFFALFAENCEKQTQTNNVITFECVYI